MLRFYQNRSGKRCFFGLNTTCFSIGDMLDLAIPVFPLDREISREWVEEDEQQWIGIDWE